MIRTSLAALAALALTTPAAPLAAQAISQDEIEARYNRALAAGYKALFVCSALANAERAGGDRSVESVEHWELAGIQAPLDDLIADMRAVPLRVQRLGTDGRPSGPSPLLAIRVAYGEGDAARYAVHERDAGCRLMPLGTGAKRASELAEPTTYGNASARMSVPFDGDTALARTGFDARYGEGARTTAVLVRREGEAVSEAYAPDFGPDVPQRTWSVAKSIAATLVGTAVHRGETDVSASAGLGLSDADPRRAITIDQALRMASGRYSDTSGNRTDPLYFGGATIAETALDTPLIHTPGSVYRYANNDTLAVVKAVDGMFDDYAPADLLADIGMADTVAETDWQGDYILSSQVWSTARDLARLGQLYLDDGVTQDGTRILPEGWRDYVSAPSGPQPGNGFGYGAGWWLFKDHQGIPSDTFAAMGNRGQYVVVVPSRDVVIVRRGEDPVGSRFDIVAFTRDTLAALD